MQQCPNPELSEVSSRRNSLPESARRLELVQVISLWSPEAGGASVATKRILEAVGRTKEVDAIARVGQPSNWARKFGNSLLRTQLTTNPVHRSVNLLPSRALLPSRSSFVSLVHFHWIGDQALSIRQIGSLSRQVPVVWTLHDTWAFTGADHHPKDTTDLRYQVGYTRASRLSGDSRIDIDAWIFRRKLRAWKSPMWLVAPSTYVKSMALNSYLARSWPVTVIPNPLDLETFAPLPPDEIRPTRTSFGLTPDRPLLVFGSGSRSAHTKGIDLLVETLRYLRGAYPEASYATFGPPSTDLPEWVHQLGYINDEGRLRQLYGASDVVLVSSRFETFSQVASESQACGTPVAGFGTSGLLDVVHHGTTGYLADPFQPKALAEAAIRVLEAGPRMRAAARQRAERLWSMDTVGRQYVDWYQRAIAEFHGATRTQRRKC